MLNQTQERKHELDQNSVRSLEIGNVCLSFISLINMPLLSWSRGQWEASSLCMFLFQLVKVPTVPPGSREGAAAAWELNLFAASLCSELLEQTGAPLSPGDLSQGECSVGFHFRDQHFKQYNNKRDLVSRGNAAIEVTQWNTVG